MLVSGIPAYRPYLTTDYSPVVTKIINTLNSQTAAILKPVDALRQSSSSYDIKISSYGQIQSDLFVLESAARTLSGANAFSRYSAKSTNPAVLSSYAQGSTMPGMYKVEVSQLAQGETLVSAAQHAITTGSSQPATVTFTFSNGDNVSLSINAPDSLPVIAATINQARIGVSASVISDDSGFRLMLNGTSGASNAFHIGVNGNDAISHLLSYSDGAADSAMQQTMAAQDALGIVNDTRVNSSSNVLSGIAGGLTLNLKGVGSVTVAIATDLPQIGNAVQAFVDAYNIAQGDMAAYMTSELSGDRALFAVSGQLKADLATQQSDGSSSSLLTQIGITSNPDGTLSFDHQAFVNAYSQNPDAISRLFTDNGNGLADKIAWQIHDVIQPDGEIASTIDQLLQKIQTNQQMESRIEENAFQNLQYSAHQYAQQLAMMIIKQIMEQFLQYTQQQSPQLPMDSASQLLSSLRPSSTPGIPLF